MDGMNGMLRWRRAAWWAVISTASLGWAWGCGGEYPAPGPATRSTQAVELPERPALVERPVQAIDAEGVRTVAGVMGSKSQHLGETISVRGIVRRLVTCPEPEPPADPAPGEEAPDDAADGPEEGDEAVAAERRGPRTCDPPPHAYLEDHVNDARRDLLVYGSMWSPLAELEEGAEVTVEGTLRTASQDGVFLRQAGLLELEDTRLPAPEADEEGGDEGDAP